MSPILLNHLLWVECLHFTAAKASSVCVFPSVKWFDLTSPTCTAVYSLQPKLSDFPSTPGIDFLSYVCPSLSVSQGEWHAPVEPLPQLPWQLFSHWAGHNSLSQWWCDKCYNYVNSVQPKCFCRLNIASWKPLSMMLLRSAANNLSCIVALLHASDSILCSPFFSFSTHDFFEKRNRWKLSN